MFPVILDASFDYFVCINSFFFICRRCCFCLGYLLGAGPQAHGGGGERKEGEGGDLQPLRILGQDVRAHDILLQRSAVQREEDRPRAILLPCVGVKPMALVFCESGVGCLVIWLISGLVDWLAFRIADWGIWLVGSWLSNQWHWCSVSLVRR